MDLKQRKGVFRKKNTDQLEEISVSETDAQQTEGKETIEGRPNGQRRQQGVGDTPVWLAHSCVPCLPA